MCSLGAWLVIIIAMMASFEATKCLAKLWTESGTLSVRVVVLSTVAAAVWAFVTSLLLAVFKWTIVGDFSRMSSASGVQVALCPMGAGYFVSNGSISTARRVPIIILARVRSFLLSHSQLLPLPCPCPDRAGASTTSPVGAVPDLEDVEAGTTGIRGNVKIQRSAGLTAPQVVLFNWTRRVVSFSLFGPFVLEPFLNGTWLLNAWLRLMGADVSMGALILGQVSDHGLVKVRGTIAVLLAENTPKLAAPLLGCRYETTFDL